MIKHEATTHRVNCRDPEVVTSVPEISGSSAVRLLPRVLTAPIATAEYMRERSGLSGMSMMSLGAMRFLFVSSANTAFNILHNESEFPDKGVGLREAAAFLRRGQLTVGSGEEWIVAKQVTRELYTPESVPYYRNVLQATLGEELRRLEVDDRQDVNASDTIAVSLMSTLCTLLFGNSCRESCTQLISSFSLLEKWTASQLLLPFDSVVRWRWRMSLGARRAYRRITTFLSENIRSGLVGPLGSTVSYRETSRDDLCDALITFLFTGYSTTTAAASWTLDFLSRHPLALNEIQDESRFLNTRGMMNRRSSAIYRAVQEAIRLRPPVWAITRRSIRETTISGIAVPGNTHVIINVYGLHRLASAWPNPSAYLPDRFSHPSIPNEYMPFGIGARRCAGMHLGMELIALVVQEFVRQFDIAPSSHPVSECPRLTLAPRGGLRLLLHRRRETKPLRHPFTRPLRNGDHR